MSDSSVFKNHVGFTTQNSALLSIQLECTCMERSNFGANFTFSIALLCPQAQRSEQFVENFSPNPKAKTVYCEVSKCALARTSNGYSGAAVLRRRAHAAGLDREHPVKSCRIGLMNGICAPQAWKNISP